MQWSSVLASAALLAFGAVIGIVPTLVIERRKHAYLLRTRWDLPLYELSKEFVGAVRQFLHLCARLDRADDRAAQLAAIDEAHKRLRALQHQIPLLGDMAVQRSARAIVFHAYAVRREAEGDGDPRPTGTPPQDRLEKVVSEFFTAVRAQLGVRAPGDVYDPTELRRS